MTFLADALPPMTERAWLAQALRLAEVLGWRTYHTWSSKHSAAGLPDVLAIRRPRVVWLELKSQRGRATPEQLAWIVAREACGQEVYIVRPLDAERLARILR